MKEQNKEFAIIHHTPKGVLIITKELEKGKVKLTMKIEDENIAVKSLRTIKIMKKPKRQLTSH